MIRVLANRTSCPGSPGTSSALNQSPPLGSSSLPGAFGSMIRLSRPRFGTPPDKKGLDPIFPFFFHFPFSFLEIRDLVCRIFESHSDPAFYVSLFYIGKTDNYSYMGTSEF